MSSVSAISLGITAATTTGGVTTCGSGTAKLRRIERKGEGADASKNILKDGPVVKVVNTDPIEFPDGTKIRLGWDESGARVVLNNVCE